MGKSGEYAGKLMIENCDYKNGLSVGMDVLWGDLGKWAGYLM